MTTPPTPSGENNWATRVQNLAPLLLAAAPRLCRSGVSREDAEDAVQEVLLKALLAKNPPDDQHALPYLWSAAKRAVITQWRRAAPQRRRFGRRVRLDPAQVPFDPSVERGKEILLDALLTAVSRMPACLRRLVELRMDGQTFAAIGRELGMHEKTVKRRVNEALECLRRLLDQGQEE